MSFPSARSSLLLDRARTLTGWIALSYSCYDTIRRADFHHTHELPKPAPWPRHMRETPLMEHLNGRELTCNTIKTQNTFSNLITKAPKTNPGERVQVRLITKKTLMAFIYKIWKILFQRKFIKSLAAGWRSQDRWVSLDQKNRLRNLETLHNYWETLQSCPE